MGERNAGQRVMNNPSASGGRAGRDEEFTLSRHLDPGREDPMPSNLPPSPTLPYHRGFRDLTGRTFGLL
jgi:hypothetical protein